MRIVVDVPHAASAIASAKRTVGNAWIVRRGVGGGAEIAIEGWWERIELWLENHGYGEGDYTVMFDERDKRYG